MEEIVVEEQKAVVELEPNLEDSVIESLLNDALSHALKSVSPADKQAYIARLNGLKEALAKKISAEKSKLRPQDNARLEGLTPDEIIALLPSNIRVSVYEGNTLVAVIPLEFVKSKSNEVGAVGSANAALTAADGKVISAKVRAGIVIPVKSKKEKTVSKKKKAKV